MSSKKDPGPEKTSLSKTQFCNEKCFSGNKLECITARSFQCNFQTTKLWYCFISLNKLTKHGKLGEGWKIKTEFRLPAPISI